MSYLCCLQPFQVDNTKMLQVILHWKNNQLQIDYQLQASMNTLLLMPSKKNVAQRCDYLWQHSCFELFLRDNGQPLHYWEFNFAPSGDWNVYRFTGYRQNMQPESFYQNITMASQIDPQQYLLSISMPILPKWQQLKTLAINVSAVLENKTGHLSYWALRHAKQQPDFHDPECFVLLSDLVLIDQ